MIVTTEERRIAKKREILDKLSNRQRVQILKLTGEGLDRVIDGIFLGELKEELLWKGAG